jgi:protein-S-isoprenylcysteine O-methyltransferase Ste14
MEDAAPSYGLWGLVILNSAVFIIFAFSFFKPATRRDWTSFGAFSAFLIALFVEMYGFPLTIYALSGWLQSRYPGVNWFSHDSGHLLEMMFGWRSNPHFGPFHILSFILIGGGFVMISSAWHALFNAQKAKQLATTGPYSYVRHPQYVGFVLVLLGFLVQWPTILTLLMFPVLVVLYVRLAIFEEKEVRTEFGADYEVYAKAVPRFFPKWSRMTGRIVFQPQETMGNLRTLP